MTKNIIVVILALVSCPLSGCLVAAAGAGAEAGYVGTQENRSAAETVSDQLIVSKIKTQLLADPEVAGLQINVDCYKGNITLKGHVKSDRESIRAISIAESVDGVHNVTSMLDIDM